jgi:RimJ/RimL family protein N-acetyltransferase
MNIIGEKVTLRAVEPRDGNMLLAIINDSDTEYMLGGGWSLPTSTSQQEEWINTQSETPHTVRTIIEENSTGAAIGMVMLTDIDTKNGKAFIHIKLAIDAPKNRGYGTDAINTMVNYAFSELRLHLVYGFIGTHNVASQKLFEKCGFIQEGLMRQRIFKRGKYIDTIPVSIINEYND